MAADNGTINDGVPSGSIDFDIDEIIRKIKAQSEGGNISGVNVVNLPSYTGSSRSGFSITSILLLGALAFILLKK